MLKKHRGTGGEAPIFSASVLFFSRAAAPQQRVCDDDSDVHQRPRILSYSCPRFKNDLRYSVM
eukprot:6139907-Amphidinium_carterae.1